MTIPTQFPHYYTDTIRVVEGSTKADDGWIVEIFNGDEWERASIACYYLEYADKLARVYVELQEAM